ncbi:MAG: ester cyclase [Candidatus Thorarchaeota archaeon]
MTLQVSEAHDMEGLVGFMSESVVNYAPSRTEPLRGRDAVKEDNIGFLATYPDVKFEITQIFGDGEMVCAEGFGEGNNIDPILGPDGKKMPSTNKSVRVPACFVVKIENGLISEICEYLDQLEFSRQLEVFR